MRRMLAQVRANHVILLEPALDPAIEQQAIARVHRIGQTRDVAITRLLVRDTVEIEVLRVAERKQALLGGSGGGNGAASAGGAGSGVLGGEGTVGAVEDSGEGTAVAGGGPPSREVVDAAEMHGLLDAVLAG